ncbi:uncharacterized protein LOC127709344 isoform X2 [Mytilus californianus]|uniref:uncharacterized protein LOC127709344 isoform X2 n=1 Tax=Mytilus californianus TaxID=6549 RepID=UPI002245AD7E|nr:uncharacterized protein LOC127709344 isoform X2 [Mytilus californianus]
MTQIRKDVLTFMPLTCTWARELMENVEKTCLSKGPLRGWIPMKMHIVDNPDLEEAFEDRKAALRKMGRTEEELKEEFGFLAESWRSVVSMCKYGVRCSEKKTNILGDTRAGLHLNRNYDMLLRFMTFRNFITARCIVVLRVVPGRVKKVMPRFKGRTLLHPSKHYDSHTSMIQPDPNITICEGLAHNFIYIYQLDEKSKLPLMHPRQAVPYAVIQLRQPYRVTVNRPFLSFRDRFLAQMKHKEATNGNKSYRTYIKRRHLKGTERKRSRSRSRKSDERNRKSEYSDSSQESDNSAKRRKRRNEMPKLKPVRKRSKTPTKQRSSSEKDQPANAETDKSCIKTKLQKIEEEIKLRQSKLTVLRHIKSNHDLEKNESDAVKEELTTIDSYSSSLTETTGCDVEFAPKISCVYSTSSIENIDMVDHAIIRYRELSSGASTPTLDEPGDQGAKQSENVACGKHLDMTDNTDRQNQIACSVTDESQCSTQRENIDNCKITLDAKKEKNDDNKESKTYNMEETDNSLQIEKKIVKEELELESSKQDDSNNVEECVKHESEEPIESSSTDKNIDIKTLFREAIYKMDPSDLYELLTEKLAGDEEDHSNEGLQQQNTAESNNQLDNEHSGDVVGLDLSCKSKCNVQGNKVVVTEKKANDNKNSCDTDCQSKIPEIRESPMSHAVSAVEDHSYSAPKESCIAGLDNLDILASVASELQAAKVVDFKTKSKSKAITSAINILNENKQEQEYIFDAEKFNPNIKGEPVVSLRKLDYSKTHDIKQHGKENEKKASDISSSTKEDSLLRVKMEPLENEIDRIETGRSHAKTNQVTNKRKNDKKLSGLEKELSSLISSSISPVIASTKRKTANSVAAAFAASEQPHIQTKNTNTRTSKHHKIIKQDDTKTKGENEPSTKSPKESNSQHASNHGKISGNQEPKFICRENLFEKFASSDVIEKSCDRETNDSNELSPPKVQKTTAETQEKTPQEFAKTVIKQEPGVSDVLASKSLSSMSVANVSSDKANCSRKPGDHLLKKSLLSPTSDLDESIIDLMNKQVTESMMHTELSLNGLSVNIKKEPVSPKEELRSDENTPVTKTESGNINETSDESTTDDKGKTTEVDLPQSIVNIKKEPCSPDAEPFFEINKFTEENKPKNQTIESNALKQSENLPITTVESQEITTEIDKTLKDLEQVIGLFSDRVRSNSGDAEKDNCSHNKIGEKAVKSSETDVKTKKFKTVLDSTLYDSSEKCIKGSVVKCTDHLSNDKQDEQLKSTHLSKEYVTANTGEEYMPIEVITGNVPPKKSSAIIIASNSITLTDPETTSVTSTNSLSKTSESYLQNTPVSLNKQSIDKIQNKHLSKKQSSKTDDTSRATRILNAVYNEVTSNEKQTLDVAKRIKKEPVTEDEYYGITSSKAIEPPKKKTGKIKTTINEKPVKRKVSESTYSSDSSPYRDSSKVHIQNRTSKQKTPTRSEKGKATDKQHKDPGLNQLEAIRTHYSTSTINDNQDIKKTLHLNRADGLSKSRIRERRSRSRSSESSCSSSTDSPEENSRRTSNAKNYSSYSRYNVNSSKRFQSIDNRTWFVKSKWDSNESKRSNNSINNQYRFGSPSKKSYNNTVRLNVNPSRTASQSQYRMGKQSYITSNSTNQNQRKSYIGGHIHNQSTFFSPSHSNQVKAANITSTSFGSSGSNSQNEINDRSKNLNTYPRISIKREKSNSLDRNETSEFKRLRSVSPDHDRRYDRKRQRSDSRDRTLLSTYKKYKNDDRDRKSFFRKSRIRSRSRDRDSSSSSDRSLSSKNRIASYRSASPKNRTSSNRSLSPKNRANSYLTTLSPKDRLNSYQHANNARYDSYRQTSPKRHTSGLISDVSCREYPSSSSGSKETKESDINNTLSKAMSTLLKKIIFDDKSNDNSKEGRMAEMVLDMVKARVTENKINPGDTFPNQSQSILQEPHKSANEVKRPYSSNTNASTRTQGSSTFERPRTTRFSSVSRPTYSMVNKPAYNNYNRSNYSSTYNNQYKTRYNPSMRSRGFSSKRGFISSSRPWSTTISNFNSRPFDSRSSFRSRGSNRPMHRGSYQNVSSRGSSKYPERESRSRDRKESLSRDVKNDRSRNRKEFHSRDSRSTSK